MVIGVMVVKKVRWFRYERLGNIEIYMVFLGKESIGVGDL